MKKYIAILIMLSVLLTSCGRNFEAPELKDPVTSNDFYVPVTRGDIGTSKVDFGTVVPKEYCYFWTTKVRVKSIDVKVGQQVKKGDVLATADFDDISSQIADLEIQREGYETSKYYSDLQIECQKNEIEYRKKGAIELGDNDLAKECDKQLAMLDENQRFDNILHNHRIESINKKISELNNLMDESTLVATHDGYVSYVKNIYADCYANENTNVVVVADYNDRYIKIKPQTEGNNEGTLVYEYEYVNYLGKKHDIVLVPYLEAEEIAAACKEIVLPKRYKFVDEENMPEAGTDVPIIRYRKRNRQNVLMVNKKSVMVDDEGNYVKVLSDDGETEKRYVQLGESDMTSYEILEGLTEGEMIYVKYETVPPTKYIERIPVMGEYNIPAKGVQAEKSDGYKCNKIFDGKGVVKYIAPTGKKIAKGEVLCEISVDNVGALTELRTAIDNEDIEHEKMYKALQDSVTQIEEQIDLLKTGKSSNDSVSQEENKASSVDIKIVATDSDAQPKEKADENVTEKSKQDKEGFPEGGKAKPDPYMLEELNCQLENLGYEIDKENARHQYQRDLLQSKYDRESKNVVDNNYQILADEDCVIREVYCKLGDEINNDKLFSLNMQDETKLFARISSEHYAGLNSLVRVQVDNEYKYEVNVRGTNNDLTYVNMVNGIVYFTKSYRGDRGYYVECQDKSIMDEKKNLEVEFYEARYTGMVLIPASCVHVENIEYFYNFSYVWAKKDGKIYKKYISGERSEGYKNFYCVYDGLTVDDVVLDIHDDNDVNLRGFVGE